MNRQIDKRNLISSFFITVLIGIAFKEMIDTIKNPIINNGITINNSFLGLTFFLVSIRFFIGNQLHLFSDSFLKTPGLLWLFDLIVIIAESIILIFLGGLCIVDKNLNIRIGFKEFLVMLFSIDVFWVFTQWLFGKIIKTWERITIPWDWAKLNGILLVLLLLSDIIFDNIYSDLGLVFLMITNLIAFIFDVILIDHYKTI
jgi:hypothetical protein